MTRAGDGRPRAGTRVGSLRPSQLLFSFGVGSVADLPHLSVMVLGLDFWDTVHAERVGEERLLAALRSRFGPQVESLRSPPYQPETPDPFDTWTRVGVPVGVFPQWLRCTSPACRMLAPLDAGLFQLKVNAFRPDQAHYEHNCTTRGRAPHAVPARFLVACRGGHLDDFPWREFSHGGTPCASPRLRLLESGVTGEAADIRVHCRNCDAGRSMAAAFGREGRSRLPRCRGRRPHLADFDERPCDQPLGTIVLGASNLWFPVTWSVLSIPSEEVELAQKVQDLWTHLADVHSLETLRFALRQMTQLAPLTGFDPAEVMAAIQARRSGQTATAEVVEELRTPEWDVFSNPEQAPEGVSEHFRLRVGTLPDTPMLKGRLEQVVLADRLREVVALTGFTRVNPPGDLGPDDQPPTEVPLTRGKQRWFPCTETRGEGIFLRFPTDEIGRWEQRILGSDRADQFKDASGGSGFSADPGPRYILLHTLSHALMREAALECGYGAASIRERLYADNALTANGGERNWAGILLYTAAPDSEGTLGGLVSLGRPEILGRLLTRAVEHSRLCSADPMCAEHAPGDGDALHGAACHACLFAAETSCERGNRFLDRSLLVDTFTVHGLGYFS